MPGHVYLDWNATTPPHPDVLRAMREAEPVAWANPSSVHGPGRRARAFVEAAREAVAGLVGLDARDVVLTSGGTEANNLALSHAFADGAGALVVARVEHPSVVRVAEALGRRGVHVVWVDPAPSGEVAAEAVLGAVDRASAEGREVRLVSLQAVNHETGVVQPVAGVAEGLAERRSAGARPGPRLHVDAVQAVGRLPARAWAGADLVTIAAHKLRGPKGVGAVATRPGVALAPLFAGGAQERGLRPGTQDPVACAGLAAAARRALGGPPRDEALAPLRDRLEARLVAVAGDAGAAASVNGTARRAPHVTNLSFEGWRGDEVAAALDLEGVA
ncbi:MAG TPA: aminotransferase class V-fold PLP-dependent enzyme, partial [Minicystis sp.]|nr:aminotransferase class V-fold PLP-dependent enzyme [Minicystis sp.]